MTMIGRNRAAKVNIVDFQVNALADSANFLLGDVASACEYVERGPSIVGGLTVSQGSTQRNREIHG